MPFGQLRKLRFSDSSQGEFFYFLNFSKTKNPRNEDFYSVIFSGFSGFSSIFGGSITQSNDG